MPTRPRKSPTPEERRSQWKLAGAALDYSLLASAFADPAFQAAKERAVRAYVAGDEISCAEAMGDLGDALHQHVPVTEWDRADLLLAAHLDYERDRAKWRSREDAAAAVLRFAPYRHPISAANPAEVDLTGDIRLPMRLDRGQVDEAIQFREDVLIPQTRRGRPRGLGISREEWEKKYPAKVRDLKRDEVKVTDETIAARMGESIWVFKRAKKLYGVPRGVSS